jgi:hypothetical protein
VAERQLPGVWKVFGKRRVLNSNLSYTEQTLLLLYSTVDTGVASEDLLAWTEHSNGAIYRRDVLRRLHRSRLVEYDEETQMVMISPKGIAQVESALLRQSISSA